MLAAPSIAIDLPLKILIWEDDQGKVWVSYNTPGISGGTARTARDIWCRTSPSSRPWPPTSRSDLECRFMLETAFTIRSSRSPGGGFFQGGHSSDSSARGPELTS